jgi:hypothetical protein
VTGHSLRALCRVLFTEAESQQAPQIVESAGLEYLEQPYIADAVQRITGEAG